jgi:hypothetical protein
VAGPPWILLAFLAGEAVYVGVTSGLPHGEQDREWLARAAGWFGAVAAAYAVFMFVVLFAWDLILRPGGVAVQSLFASAGAISVLTALTPLTRATAAVSSRRPLPLTPVINGLSAIFIFGAVAAAAQLSLHGLDWLHLKLLPLEPRYEILMLLTLSLGLLAIGAAISFFVNVNWFSLHAFYRDRLVKTFLGASNLGGPEKEGRNPFNGFSEKDNLPIAEVWDTIKREREAGDPGRLYPVINISLNVLASDNLAWQERKAESFVCTPQFTGGHTVSYRPSKVYAAFGFGRSTWGTEPTRRSISIGTAMAISGAAVSPNWGYHSSPLTSFLMMLSNVRLGWWMGNPRASQAWRYRGPGFSLKLFIQEALGWTKDTSDWVYLSDGGHFENLGIYEMVRRRCRTIVVSDAGADPNCNLEDLGNAVRKIAIDFGVRIEFERIRMRKRSDIAQAGVYCAVGTIYYPEGVNGTIVYFKPGFYGIEEPADVRAYAAANAKFPHETTLNQWFGESQFESYRSLGAYVIEKIGREQDKLESGQHKFRSESGLGKFVETAEIYLKEYEEKFPADGANVVEIRKAVPVRRAVA